MRVELDIVFSERPTLSGSERSAVERIRLLCLESDGFEPGLRFDTGLNAVRSIPAWFLAEAKGQAGETRLVGAAGLLLTGQNRGELAACVDPLFRRSGLFERLFAMGLKALQGAGIPELLLVSDARLSYGSAIADRLGAFRARGEITMKLVPEHEPVRAAPAYEAPVRLIPFARGDLAELSALSSRIFDAVEAENQVSLESTVDAPKRERFSARSAEGILGLVTLSLEGNGYMIGGLGVLPEFRRRGYGGAILDAAISIARKRGAASIRLDVDETNEPVIALFRSRGFVEDTRTDYWRVGLETFGRSRP